MPRSRRKNPTAPFSQRYPCAVTSLPRKFVVRHAGSDGFFHPVVVHIAGLAGKTFGHKPQLVRLPVEGVADVTFAAEQRVDQPGTLVGSFVVEERPRLGVTRNPAGDVEINAAQKPFVAERSIERRLVLLVILPDQGIDATSQRRHVGPRQGNSTKLHRRLAMIESLPALACLRRRQSSDEAAPVRRRSAAGRPLSAAASGPRRHAAARRESAIRSRPAGQRSSTPLARMPAAESNRRSAFGCVSFSLWQLKQRL